VTVIEHRGGNATGICSDNAFVTRRVGATVQGAQRRGEPATRPFLTVLVAEILPADHPRSPWLLSVAPMMDWTDRHCRVFHRLITRHARLYTEMVTTGALLHGDVARHLDFDPAERPLALQLGGSETADLAACARLAARWGYDEINLNCGCPSERVQRGSFGACLMAEPALVRDCVAAMREAVDLPVTVKHRIGIDRGESYEFVRDFVGTVAQAGCTVFIVHARNAWLKGLSPKENREVPPLRHEFVYRLKRDFPLLTIVLNGGVTDNAQIALHLQHVDGVMLGREAYHHPWLMAEWDRRFFGDDSTPAPSREAVEAAMVEYMTRLAAQGITWPHAARHMMGLQHGLPGARRWRQVWSDHHLKEMAPAQVMRQARQAMQPTGAVPQAPA
jgi:tRNA-dihydrouridine synthase A